MINLILRIPSRIAIGFVLFAVIAIGSTVYRDHLQGNASGLRAGDCFDAPATDGRVGDVLHHPCTEAHTAEVYGVFTYPENAVSGTLGPTDGVLLDRCDAAFRAFTGDEVNARQDLLLGFIQPTADGWTKGKREITCFLQASNRRPMTHSERQPTT